MTYAVFQDHIARINDVLCTVNLMDQILQLPERSG
jgi:hypothetical protein